MLFCDLCVKNIPGLRVTDGFRCCNECGKILENLYLYEEPNFENNSAGQEMKQRRAEEAKNLGPPQSAAEATKQMLRTKVAPENPKKVRFEIPSDNYDYLKSKFEDKIQDDELGSVDKFEDGEMHRDYYGNADKAYDYEDDGHNFDY